MTTEERKALCGAATIEGVPCTIGGYANGRASISGGFAGFWGADWETVKEKGGKLTAADVWFVSSAWLGTGEEMPEKLWRRIPLKYRGHGENND